MATTIRYAKAQSSLGPFVAAQSERGVAMVEFGEMSELKLAELQRRFSAAEIVEDEDAMRETLDRIAALIDQPGTDCDLAVDLQGSGFELRVWNALREVPAGTTVSYGEIAGRLGVPREAREVGEACAANVVAVVVPCHRVVKKDGTISGYRWGVRRKRALIDRERALHLLPAAARDPHAGSLV